MEKSIFGERASSDESLLENWQAQTHCKRVIYDIYDYFVHLDHHPVNDNGIYMSDHEAGLNFSNYFKFDDNLHSFEHKVSLRTSRVLLINLVVHSILSGDKEIRPEDNVPIHKVQSCEPECYTVETRWKNSQRHVLEEAIATKRRKLLDDFSTQLASLKKIGDQLNFVD